MGKASCILFAALCLVVVYSLPVDQQPQKKSSEKQVSLPASSSTAKPVHHYRDGPLRKRDIHQSSDSSSSEEDSRSDEQEETDSQHLLLRQVSAGSQKQENIDRNNPNILASNPSSATGPSTLSPYQNRSKRDLSGPVSTAEPPTRINLGANQNHTSEKSTLRVRDLSHSQLSSTTPSTTSEPTKVLLTRGSEVASPSERERRDLKDQLANSTQQHSGSSQSSGNLSHVAGEEHQRQQRDINDQQSSTTANQPRGSGQSTQASPSLTGEQQNLQRKNINDQQSSTTTHQPQTSQSNPNVIREQHNLQQRDVNDQQSSASTSRPRRSSQSTHTSPSVTEEQHNRQRRDINDKQSSTTTNRPQKNDQSSQNNPSVTREQHNLQQRDVNDQPSTTTKQPQKSNQFSQNNPSVAGDQHHHQRRDLDSQQASTSTNQPSTTIRLSQNPPHVSKETLASLSGGAVQNNRQRRDVNDEQGSTLTSEPSISPSNAQTAQNENSSIGNQNRDSVSSPPHVLLSNTAYTTEKEDNSHIQKVSS